MTGGRPGQVTATEKAPWMPDFQKDEWVQYFLEGKVSCPDTASCPPTAPCHPGTCQGRRLWALPLTRP